MTSFVRIVTFETKAGRFDDYADSIKLNKILIALQAEGATIREVTHRVSYSEHNNLTIAVYLIQYEAPALIERDF